MAARLAAVALHAPHDAILHVIRRLATLASDLTHDFRPLTKQQMATLYIDDHDVYLYLALSGGDRLPQREC